MVYQTLDRWPDDAAMVAVNAEQYPDLQILPYGSSPEQAFAFTSTSNDGPVRLEILWQLYMARSRVERATKAATGVLSWGAISTSQGNLDSKRHYIYDEEGNLFALDGPVRDLETHKKASLVARRLFDESHKSKFCPGFKINPKEIHHAVNIEAANAVRSSYIPIVTSHDFAPLGPIIRAPIMTEQSIFQIFVGFSPWLSSADLCLGHFDSPFDSHPISLRSKLKRIETLAIAIFGDYCKGLMSDLTIAGENAMENEGLKPAFVEYLVEESWRAFWQMLQTHDGGTFMRGSWLPKWKLMTQNLPFTLNQQIVWEADDRLRPVPEKQQTKTSKRNLDENPPPEPGDSKKLKSGGKIQERRLWQQTGTVNPTQLSSTPPQIRAGTTVPKPATRPCLAQCAHDVKLMINGIRAPQCLMGAKCKFAHDWQKAVTRSQMVEEIETKHPKFIVDNPGSRDQLRDLILLFPSNSAKGW